jgi:hypothetical protein
MPWCSPYEAEDHYYGRMLGVAYAEIMSFYQISRTRMICRAERWRVRRGRFIVPTADLSAFGVHAPQSG